MDIQEGAILTGKVTGITKFGAFVQLAPGKSGLVYISEIANTFVNNVADFLTVGQEVQVKVLKIDENGRINLQGTGEELLGSDEVRKAYLAG